jgi:2-polyprenyl-3-methyl-5-hydroxy-6-metoxy-1,4-benzoquinol methylase
MPRCNVCDRDAAGEVESARVRSNVRKFASETFAVWRCPHCKSIHAKDEVDLAHYYADYPFHKLGESKVDWMLAAMYGNALKRLTHAGIGPEHAILDYGCGGGLFLKYLASRGFVQATGYDEYSDAYKDASVLKRTYDCVTTQDVIEHVPEPRALASTLDALARPGGVIVIGTPNAETIDLAQPDKRVHALHQPYHRHILSRTALLALGRDMGWDLVRYYPTQYSNTRVPFVNTSFLIHYFRAFDDNVDLAIEPIHVNSWKIWSPLTLAHALFGSFWAPETDVAAIFRKPATPHA